MYGIRMRIILFTYEVTCIFSACQQILIFFRFSFVKLSIEAVFHRLDFIIPELLLLKNLPF